MKKRKSEKLTKEELAAIKSFVKRFDTLTEAAEAIGMSHQNLNRAMVYKSGSPETVGKIRLAISLEEAQK